MININIKSPEELIESLQNISDNFSNTAHDNIKVIFDEIFNDSQNVYCPVLSGDLRSSGSLNDASDVESGEIIFIIEYSALYAEIVHEDMTKQHRSPQSAKYVETPLLAKLDDIEQAYINSMDEVIEE